ncbi:unnamed protein product [Pylaiella littoralis]
MHFMCTMHGYRWSQRHLSFYRCTWLLFILRMVVVVVVVVVVVSRIGLIANIDLARGYKYVEIWKIRKTQNTKGQRDGYTNGRRRYDFHCTTWCAMIISPLLPT